LLSRTPAARSCRPAQPIIPLQNQLVAEAHQRLMRSGDPGVIPMPVGQIIGRMNEVIPVADLIKSLAAELDEAVNRLDSMR
jgi:NAD(P)H-dependent flavin oxidoreductase YrpB (nitropropane dioxygenase family)